MGNSHSLCSVDVHAIVLLTCYCFIDQDPVLPERVHGQLLLRLVQVGGLGGIPGLDGHEGDKHGSGFHRSGGDIPEGESTEWGTLLIVS